MIAPAMLGPFELILIPFIALPMIAVIVLIALGLASSRTRKATLIVVGVVAAIVVLMGLFVSSWSYVRMERSNQAGAIVAREGVAGRGPDSSRPMPPAARIPPEDIASWGDAAARQWPADVYPTRKAAIQSLADQVGDKLRFLVDPGQQIQNIHLTGGQWRETSEGPGHGGTVTTGSAFLDPQIRDEVAAMLSSQFPQAKVSSNRNAQPKADVLIRINVDLTHQQSALGSVANGVITLVAEGATRRSSTLACRFVDKPWFDNFDAFAESQRSRRWLLAQSRRPATSQGEAHAQAVIDAAQQLEPMLRDAVRREPAMLQRAVGDRDWLRDLIIDHLRDGPCIADQFTQRFDRPYGQVFRQQLLIDASDEALASIAIDAHRKLAAGRRTFASTAGGVAALFALIVAVYFVLNATTRGYYAGRLKTGTVLLFGAGVVLLILFLV